MQDDGAFAKSYGFFGLAEERETTADRAQDHGAVRLEFDGALERPASAETLTPAKTA